MKHDLNSLISEKTEGAKIRCKSRWDNMGEYPTKYYLNLEKRNIQNRTIARLQRDDGIIIEDTHEILSEIKKFYEKLYTSKGPIETTYLEKINAPKLNDNDRDRLDAPITIEELGLALRELKNNHSPGMDGLPADWYKMFWPKIKNLYHKVLLEMIEMGKMHLSACRGIISLMEKPDRNILKISQWRPLTLLNTDNKIYTKNPCNEDENYPRHIGGPFANWICTGEISSRGHN